MAEQSRADADNAYRESMHLSPEQFIQLEAIKMQAKVCGPAGKVCGPAGKATCTFIHYGGATPVYNLGK
ncbi:MAG: hypothetical protein ABSE86_08365 [Bryobacteraceae bacterium]|jgi:hypothetical protein